MRFSSTRSTVPTWTPSAPITSICSLIRLIAVIAGVLPVNAKVQRHQSISVQWHRIISRDIDSLFACKSYLWEKAQDSHQLLFIFCTVRGLSAVVWGAHSDCRVIVQNYIQERVMDLQVSVVIDETQLAEFVHEEAHTRASGDHLGKSGLADFCLNRLWPSFFPEICH